MNTGKNGKGKKNRKAGNSGKNGKGRKATRGSEGLEWKEGFPLSIIYLYLLEPGIECGKLDTKGRIKTPQTVNPRE